MNTFVIIIAVIGGVIAGAVVTWLLLVRQGPVWLNEQRIRDMFARVSQETLRANSSDFSQYARRAVEEVTAPLKTALDEQRRKLDDLERERQKAYGGIEQMLRQMNDDQKHLQQETAKLVSSLRQPQVRGRWGEIQLRRVVELAGMNEHCDFVEQLQTTGNEGTIQRPDLLVHLPNQRVIIVDAKAPLEAYLRAHEATDEKRAKEHFQQHAKQIRNHVAEIHKRDYKRHFKNAFEYLVLFIPGESFFRAALEHDPELLEFALEKGIIITTPLTLIALLKTVALGWREARLAENAQKIIEEGEKLYSGLSALAGHIHKLGNELKQSIEAYNHMIGSFERTLFHSARRLRELGIHKEDLTSPEPIDATVRSLSRPELTAAPTSGSEQTPPSAVPSGDPQSISARMKRIAPRLRPDETGQG